jgi:hypothetical protein
VAADTPWGLRRTWSDQRSEPQDDHQGTAPTVTSAFVMDAPNIQHGKCPRSMDLTRRSKQEVKSV